MMADESTKNVFEKTLAVPGVVCVVPLRGAAADGTDGEAKVICVGPAAGWMVPLGLSQWERELSFVARADMTEDLARALRATLPQEQIAPKRYPAASAAVAASPLLGLSGDLVDDARKSGARVHTVGVDRVSSDFYYFADGGRDGRPSVSVQGNLIEMLTPSLDPASTNADIARLLEALLDRLLASLSGGTVSELEVELADALPRLARNAMGLTGTDLDAFEAQATALADRSLRHESSARRLADVLAGAVRAGHTAVRVPLYGEARSERLAPLELTVAGQTLRLPEWLRWTVRGSPVDDADVGRVAPAKAQRATTAGSGVLRSSGAAATGAAATTHAATPVATSTGSSVATPPVESAARAASATAEAPAMHAGPTAAAGGAASTAKPQGEVASASRTAEPAPIAPRAVVVVASAPAAEPPVAVAPAGPESSVAGSPSTPDAAVREAGAHEGTEQAAAPSAGTSAPAAEAPSAPHAAQPASAEAKSSLADEPRKGRDKPERRRSAARDEDRSATAVREARKGKDKDARSDSRSRARPPRPSAEARRSLAIFVVGLLAFVAAVAYSAWRLWYGPRLP